MGINFMHQIQRQSLDTYFYQATTTDRNDPSDMELPTLSIDRILLFDNNVCH